MLRGFYFITFLDLFSNKTTKNRARPRQIRCRGRKFQKNYDKSSWMLVREYWSKMWPATPISTTKLECTPVVPLSKNSNFRKVWNSMIFGWLKLYNNYIHFGGRAVAALRHLVFQARSQLVQNHHGVLVYVLWALDNFCLFGAARSEMRTLI